VDIVEADNLFEAGYLFSTVKGWEVEARGREWKWLLRPELS